MRDILFIHRRFLVVIGNVGTAGFRDPGAADLQARLDLDLRLLPCLLGRLLLLQLLVRQRREHRRQLLDLLPSQALCRAAVEVLQEQVVLRLLLLLDEQRYQGVLHPVEAQPADRVEHVERREVQELVLVRDQRPLVPLLAPQAAEGYLAQEVPRGGEVGVHLRHQLPLALGAEVVFEPDLLEELRLELRAPSGVGCLVLGYALGFRLLVGGGFGGPLGFGFLLLLFLLALFFGVFGVPGFGDLFF